MTTDLLTVSPQSVSAYLRRNGYTPAPRSRAGVHVTNAHSGAAISVCFDGNVADDVATAEVIVEALRADGYVVYYDETYPSTMLVTGREQVSA